MDMLLAAMAPEPIQPSTRAATPPDMTEIARLEERRLASAVFALADHSEPFGGGVLARGAPGTWINACFGAGLDAPIGAAELDHLIDVHSRAGVEPRIELAPFVHESTLAALADARFVVRGFDNILVRTIDASEDGARCTLPEGVAIEVVDRSNPAEVDRFVRLSLAGFAVASTDVAEPSLESMRRAMQIPGTTAIVAQCDGEPVGAAAMEVCGEVACLFGASVAPEARGRGIQRAMLQWRLRIAAENGVRFVTIGSRPGETTERNVRRLGFTLAYMRTTLVRPGPGLAPIVE